jgi:ABC-2 type transport system permease protein
MISTLLRFELRALLRDRATLPLLAVFALLLALGLANGLRWAEFQRTALARTAAADTTALAAAETLAGKILRAEQPAPRGWWNNPSDVRGFAHYLMVTHATKPPTPLAPLALGQSDLLPYYFKVSARTSLASLTAYEIENPHRLLLGRFDLAFALITLLPLVVAALGYNVLAADRERGTLALLVAQPVSLARLIAARLALRIAALALVVIPTLSVGLALGGFAFTAPGAFRALALWSLVVVAYTAFWFALTTLVAVRARSSASAALSLGGAWLVLVVVLPWSLNLAATHLHPLPSRLEFIGTQRDAADAAEAKRSDLLGRYLHDHPEFAPADGKPAQAGSAAIGVAANALVEASLLPVQARFDGQLARQQALIDRWQWLSPAILTQQAFNDLAGASRTRHTAFLVQTADYLAALRRYFNPAIIAGNFTFTAFRDWPRWTWREPAPVRTSTHAALLGLLLPALACAALTVRTLRRTSVIA